MPAYAISTDNFPAAERVALWREWNWTLFGGLHTDCYDDTDFDGHLARMQAGDIVLTRLEAGRHRVRRTQELARADAASYLKIVAPLQGRACIEQNNRHAWVGPDAWTIYDTTRSYAIDNPGSVEHLVVMLPKERLTERGMRIDNLVARTIGAGSGIARVALSTMRSTFQELPHMSPEAAHGAGELIAELVRLSLLELGGQETQLTQRAALKDRIRSYVSLHLRDPQLSVDRIATALNCSKRHLYNAWGDEPETLANHIQTLRLEACLRELQHPMSRTRPITDIALSWGFSNPSHFSRVFRERMGRSPSEVRASAN